MGGVGMLRRLRHVPAAHNVCRVAGAPRQEGTRLPAAQRFFRSAEALRQEATLKEAGADFLHDIDVGSLYCHNANVCLLIGGKLCSKFQHEGRSRQVLNDLRAALLDGGFFFLRNTTLDKDQPKLKKLFQHVKDFHSLPAEAKQQVAVPAEHEGDALLSGWLPLGQDLSHSNHLVAHSEIFDVVRGDEKWPEGGVKGSFRGDVSECHDTLDYIAKELISAIEQTFGLNSGSFDFLHHKDQGTSTRLRLQRFRGTEALPELKHEGRTYGVGEMTDCGLFSIVVQDGPGGLQVQDNEGTWHEVTVGPNRLIVLVGAMLETLTNGAISAARHRIVPKGSDVHMLELSVVLHEHVEVEPVSDLVDDGQPVYAKTTQKEQIKKHYNSTDDVPFRSGRF